MRKNEEGEEVEDLHSLALTGCTVQRATMARIPDGRGHYWGQVALTFTNGLFLRVRFQAPDGFKEPDGAGLLMYSTAPQPPRRAPGSRTKDSVTPAEIHAYREGMLIVREILTYKQYGLAADLLQELSACRWSEARRLVTEFYGERPSDLVRSFLTALAVLEGVFPTPVLPSFRGIDASPAWWAAAAMRADDDARWAHHALSRLGLNAAAPRELLDAVALLAELSTRFDTAIPWPPPPGAIEAAREAIAARRVLRGGPHAPK